MAVIGRKALFLIADEPAGKIALFMLERDNRRRRVAHMDAAADLCSLAEYFGAVHHRIVADHIHIHVAVGLHLKRCRASAEKVAREKGFGPGIGIRLAHLGQIDFGPVELDFNVSVVNDDRRSRNDHKIDQNNSQDHTGLFFANRFFLFAAYLLRGRGKLCFLFLPCPFVHLSVPLSFRSIVNIKLVYTLFCIMLTLFSILFSFLRNRAFALFFLLQSGIQSDIL